MTEHALLIAEVQATISHYLSGQYGPIERNRGRLLPEGRNAALRMVQTLKRPDEEVAHLVTDYKQEGL